jgi:hypothetical protein
MKGRFLRKQLKDRSSPRSFKPRSFRLRKWVPRLFRARPMG